VTVVGDRPHRPDDVEAIRDVVLRYCAGIDRLDPETMKSAYWPEATDDHGTFVGNAWEFVDRCMGSHARWRSTLHCIFNHRVEFDSSGESARGEAYNVTYLFPLDGPGVHLWCGRYLDSYEKRGNEWRVLHRVCVHEGTTVLEAAGMPIDFEAFRQGTFDRPSSGRPIGP
jgi:hypothetical protein